MADYCGNCIHMDWNNKDRYSSRDKYYCGVMHRYVEPTEKGCYNHIEDKSQRNGSSSSGNFTPTGCPITAILCYMLGYDDNGTLMTIIRNFRENILKSKEEYLPILMEYDLVGSHICNGIQNDPESYQTCTNIFRKFLIPCVGAIITGNIDEAIAIYQNMIGVLKLKYGIPDLKPNLAQNYDIETLGKGRVRLLPNIEQVVEA